jgi:RNA-dependent RNA polymerase
LCVHLRAHVNPTRDGVPYETFKIYQDAAVRDAKDSVNSLEATARLLEGHGLGTSYRLPSVMASLRRLGITSLNQDPFYLRTIEFAVHHVLREIKHKAGVTLATRPRA